MARVSRFACVSVRADMAMDYAIVTKQPEEGFLMWVPRLSGCWSEGATEEEALENIQDAIRDYLAVTKN